MLDSILSEPITLPSFLICIAATMVLGVLTALVFTYRSRHSASFALTLALLPMAVAVVIMLVNGNIGTGVAVAGAFALVRFRSVPGSAREIAAVFTAMAIGLALGLGLIGIAIIFFLGISAFTLLLTRIRFGDASKDEKEIKITLPEDYNYETLFDDLFKKYTVRAELEKVKTSNMGTLFELTYIAVFRDSQIPKEFIDELRVRNGNLNITICKTADREML